MIHLIPVTTSITSEGMARLYRDNIWKLHGLPKKIISDREPQYASKFMKELCKTLGITHNLSTAYHPQTDRQTERINQEVEQYLRIYCNHLQEDWADWIAIAEFAYNNHQNASIQNTPFKIVYGTEPWNGDNLPPSEFNEAAGNFSKKLQQAREEAQAALKQSAEAMKLTHDRSIKPITFKIGQKVWLEASDIKTTRPSKKLEDKRYGL